MRNWSAKYATVALCIALPLAAQAGDDQSGITDQTYQGGKYNAVRYAGTSSLNSCPREYRGIYRGSLYCRQPSYQVVAQSHPSCPKDVWGLYKGNLYCFGKR